MIVVVRDTQTNIQIEFVRMIVLIARPVARSFAVQYIKFKKKKQPLYLQ